MTIIFKNTIEKIIYLEENLKFVRLEKEKIEAFANKDEDIFTCICQNGARTVEYYSHSAKLLPYHAEFLNDIVAFVAEKAMMKMAEMNISMNMMRSKIRPKMITIVSLNECKYDISVRKLIKFLAHDIFFESKICERLMYNKADCRWFNEVEINKDEKSPWLAFENSFNLINF
ncbi:hypothetical protein BpHYR1_043170 [Brachionus plicatilis]|uniref:Uncharacterized protein n=1 Tax=Brachionus plicatilis TaxID=10195 RepID=A0A3M7QHQ2_BRAPC|nr:hypothetical protein BpHYR1_043170 [Brachionus plicatilis]